MEDAERIWLLEDLLAESNARLAVVEAHLEDVSDVMRALAGEDPDEALSE